MGRFSKLLPFPRILWCQGNSHSHVGRLSRLSVTCRANVNVDTLICISRINKHWFWGVACFMMIKTIILNFDGQLSRWNRDWIKEREWCGWYTFMHKKLINTNTLLIKFKQKLKSFMCSFLGCCPRSGSGDREPGLWRNTRRSKSRDYSV